MGTELHDILIQSKYSFRARIANLNEGETEATETTEATEAEVALAGVGVAEVAAAAVVGGAAWVVGATRFAEEEEDAKFGKEGAWVG